MNEQANSLLAAATSLMAEGKRPEAIAVYRRLLASEPRLPDSWYNLGLLLRQEGRFEEALDAYEEALKRGVAEPEEVHVNRAVILADHLRRESEAISALKAALAENGDYAPAWLNLGNLREETGDREEAISCYDRILPPTDGSARPHQDCRYEALARLAHLAPPDSLTDPLLGRLATAARSPGVMAPQARANLLYALGRTLDALGDYDDAFAAYEDANRCVRRAGPSYDPNAIAKTVDGLISAFPTPSPTGVTAAAPGLVFICGMFRSGSTLAEQVLAAHPLVIAGGELNLLNRIAEFDLAPYPQSVRSLSNARAASLADSYRRSLLKLFPEAGGKGMIATDKRPDNFLRIGLIKRLFPAVKIIHTVRDPADTCLSVYFQHIDQGVVGYASDLVDCGRYYGQYRRMMEHWKRLYPDDILDFDYDRFVAAPRPAIEMLLGFAGLDWDERCLDFHALKNPVKTASYWQVRKPLYKESSGRRRHYEKHLGPLNAALRAAGVDPA